MITKSERVMLSSSFEEVRSLWIYRALLQNKRILDEREGVVSLGYEDVPDYDGSSLSTSDGREIIVIKGRAYALRPEVHAQRRAAALERARVDAESRQKSGRADEVKESIAATTCPQMIGGKPCGGALNRKGVCSSCVTGKMGFSYRYTCETCGFDIVTKTELAE